MGSFLCDWQGLESGWLTKVRETLELYNLYGRIITKKPKACAYYYDLLNANSKKDGWVEANIKLEAELTEFDDELEYDKNEFMNSVMEVIRMPFLNRLKQFMLRLLRNNLFLGKKACKIKNPEESLCFLCNNHRESRVLLFRGCETVKKLLQLLIRILKKAGCLQNSSKIRYITFQDYNFNLIENISLVTLWNFIYNEKFNSGKLQGIPFMFWFKKTMSQLTAFPPPCHLRPGGY